MLITFKVTDVDVNNSNLDKPFSYQEVLKNTTPLIQKTRKIKKVFCIEYNKTIKNQAPEILNQKNNNNNHNSDSDDSDYSSNSTYTDSEHEHSSPDTTYIPPKPTKPKIVLTSSSLENSKSGGFGMSTGTTNSLVYAAYSAYSNHHCLELRPDDIWISILVQLSSYINEENSSSQRMKFINPIQGKKKKLSIRVDQVDNVNTPFNVPYEKMTIDMINNISKDLKDDEIRNWVIPNFSTTTETDRMVGCVSLMGTFKKYYNYRFKTSCGIPSVTLHGNVDDWLEIKSRVSKLIDFDKGDQILTNWAKLLDPIVDQFIQSAQGKPDPLWWNEIAIYKSGSGTSTLSGWITTFCYFNDSGIPISTFTDPTIKTTTPWPTINIIDIPKGYISVPVKLKISGGKTFKTELFAGHMSLDVHEKFTYQPRIDWCLLLMNK